MAATDEERPADEVVQELADEEEKLGEALRLRGMVHRLRSGLLEGAAAAAEKSGVLHLIRAREMGPYYKTVVETLAWNYEPGLLDALTESNKSEADRLEAKIVEAQEEYGDLEVYDARKAKAEFYARIGDSKRANNMYNTMLQDKHLSTGQKVDIAMAKALIALFHGDLKRMKAQIDAAKELNDKGGDWDRRNRLKVYEGMWCLCTRDFDRGATLLLDVVATFTAYEMFSYKQYVYYTVLATVLTLPRLKLKAKVVESPDILSVILDVPHLSPFLNSLHGCKYDEFMQALIDIQPSIASDQFLGEHASYYVREVRIKAYSQFLAAYKSVTLQGMAGAFGVGEAFMDGELSRFIAANRLNARIDKVGGVVETTRPDAKNAQYQSVIKHGDALLNRVQRLSRTLNT